MMAQFRGVQRLDIQLARNGFVTNSMKDWLGLDPEVEYLQPQVLPWVEALIAFYGFTPERITVGDQQFFDWVIHIVDTEWTVEQDAAP